MNITKEQIIALEKGEVTAKELFPELFQMKVGSFYKHNYGAVINYLGESNYRIKGFGINSEGSWFNNDQWSKGCWTEITPEEALPYFVKEAEKRGFTKGVNFTIKRYYKYLFTVYSYDNWKFIDGELCLDGLVIMNNQGEWVAEIVNQDPRISELIKEYGKEELIKIIQK